MDHLGRGVRVCPGAAAQPTPGLQAPRPAAQGGAALGEPGRETAAALPRRAERKGTEPMTEAELRALLTAIRDLGMIGRMHPEERIETPECGPLLVALGTIAGLATLALEGEMLPPQQLVLSEEEFDQLNAGGEVIRRTEVGYRVKLVLAQ